MNTLQRGGWVLGSLFGAVLLATVGHAQVEHSIEYQLALLGSNQTTANPVASANAISRFRTILDELSLNYRQTREEMGYAAMAIWKKLQEQKLEANLMQILDGMNLVASGEGKQDFLRNLTLYYALRTRGLSHQQTLRHMLLLTATGK